MSMEYCSHDAAKPFARRLARIAGIAAIGLPVLAHAADSTQAQIDDLQQQIDAMKASQAPAPDSSLVTDAELKRYMAGESNLTWKGLTLYGTVDIGVSYQNHGAPLNDYFYPGVNELVQKNSTKSVFGVTPSGLSQSKVGLKIEEPVTDTFNVVGKAEIGFNPQSGNLSDAVKSIQQNNGIALANQTANADGSRAGQVFNGEAYLGVDSRTYGRFTLGRLDSLLLDNVVAYDPMGGSYAFSLIGWSGTANGGGFTQDARLDNAARYAIRVGPFHAIALAQLNGYDSGSLGAGQADLGVNWGGLSVDATFSEVKDAIHLASVPGGVTVNGVTNNSYLAANVADNIAEALMLKYGLGRTTVYAGYEHILSSDPSHPLSNGAQDIGGYLMAVTNNNYQSGNQVQQIAWTGAKYGFSLKFHVTGAYYYLHQNNFSGGSCAGGTAYSNSGKCAGDENVLSAMADYAFTRRFDIYGGVMYSHVNGGLDSGYAYNNAVSPMVGARFNF